MQRRGDRWSQADAILDRALDLSVEARQALLDRECADDPELRGLVERLLAGAESDTADGLQPGPVPLDVVQRIADGMESEESQRIGQRIGPFRVLRELGRGGMAVVYLAERADGGFEQQVAIKLNQSGLDTAELLGRFERERQILARASHPNVARLLDGGTTEDGRPYFVMEHVDGLPIDQFCDEQRLTLPRRLELFRQVCDAVIDAHRNLVVHRDIKPSNILVTRDGVVKLLDFGIAGYLSPEAAGEGDAELTVDGRRMMTPAWASPEQVQGLPVTTASDIYQLGLLLYVLLTGCSPYRASPSDVAALAGSIVKDPPTRPSSVVTRSRLETGRPSPDQCGKNRGLSVRGLRRALVGDLDNILLKALRKEPDRRYSSAAQFAEDIEHYLAGRPVSARGDSLGYRLTKLVLRHRMASGFAALAVLSLIGLAVSTSLQSRRIAAERDRANVEAATATQVSDFLVDLFKINDPGENRGQLVTAREVLERGAVQIGEELGDQPETQARLKAVLGRVYQNLGLYDRALPLLEEALETRRETLGDDDPAVAKSLDQLGWLLQQKGQLDEAEARIREALAIRLDRLGPNAPNVAESQNNLGLLLHMRSRFDEAEPLFRQALEFQRGHYDGAHAQTANTLSNLGLTLLSLDRLEEAEQVVAESLHMRREALGPDHPYVAVALDTLGRVYRLSDRPEEAEQMMREALELRRRVLGEPHPAVSQSLNNLAAILVGKGDLAGATKIFLELMESDREMLGEDHPDYGNLVFNVGVVHRMQDDHATAIGYLERARRILAGAYGEQHSRVAGADGHHGDSLRELGRYADAEPPLLRAYAALETILGPEHRRTRTAARRLVALYRDAGRPEEADRWESRAAEPN